MSFEVTYVGEHGPITDIVNATEIMDLGQYLKFYGQDPKVLVAMYSAGSVIKAVRIEEKVSP